MCFLYSIFSKKNKEKGFSLLELLVAIGVAGVVSLLVTSISDINLRNLVSARMSMDEQHNSMQVYPKQLGKSLPVQGI